MRTIWEIGSLMISNIVHPGIVLCYSGIWMNLTIFEVKYPICARPPQPPKRGNEGMKQTKNVGYDVFGTSSETPHCIVYSESDLVADTVVHLWCVSA